VSIKADANCAFENTGMTTTITTDVTIPDSITYSADYIYVTTNGNYFRATGRDLVKSAKILPKTIKWGATAGDELFTGAKILFVPVAFVGGAVATVCSGTYNIIANLFEHGDEIVIKKGMTFNIILLSKLDIPS
jgi:hypothetical protein